MKHSILPPLRDETLLPKLVFGFFRDTADAAFEGAPNPHRHHPVLGDPDEVDRLCLSSSKQYVTDELLDPYRNTVSVNGIRKGKRAE